jgi:hypothetical protein
MIYLVRYVHDPFNLLFDFFPRKHQDHNHFHFSWSKKRL